MLLEQLGVESFTMCLARGGGRLEFNAAIPAATEYRHLKTIGESAWATSLDQVSVGSGSAAVTLAADVCDYRKCGAIIDSGTTLLTMPKAMQAGLLRALEQQCATKGCLERAIASPTCTAAALSHLPTISFRMSGEDLEFTPEQYMGQMNVRELPPSTRLAYA